MHCRADAVAKLEYSRRVLILAVFGHIEATVFVDERATIVQLWWVCGAREQEAGAHVTSRWQFGADSSIILEFIAPRVKARGDGPFVL